MQLTMDPSEAVVEPVLIADSPVACGGVAKCPVGLLKTE